LDQYHPGRGGFRAVNLTPVIDIVFLLIVFFMVVAKFIEAESFDIAVPKGCGAAVVQDEGPGQLTTVTVMRRDNGAVDYAVGPDVIEGGREDTVRRLAEMIEARLARVGGNRRVVSLRVDEDVEYASAQYALAAVAQSTATDVHLAVLKGRSPRQPD